MTIQYHGYTGTKANADLDALAANAAAGAAAYGVAAAAQTAAAAALAAANAGANAYPQGENRTTATLAAYESNNREYNIIDYYSALLTNWSPIVNAASLAASVAGGGIVRVPVGTFDCSTSLLTYAGVTIAGTGPLSVVRAKAGLGAPVRMIVPSAVGISGGGLRDITLDHRGDLYPSNGSTPCVSVDKTDQFTIQNVVFKNAQTMAVWCDSPTVHPTTNLQIHGCRFLGYAGDGTTTTGTAGGVSLFGAITDVVIAGNYFTNHRDDAVAIQDSVNGRPYRVTVTGNVFLNNNRRLNGSTPHAVLVYGAQNSAVTANVVDGTVASGIWAGSGAFYQLDGFTCTGNTILNAGNSSDSTVGVPIAGINVLGDRANSRYAENVTIAGNTIVSPKGNGIQAQDCVGLTISGNTTRLCANSGVSLLYCLDFAVTGNTMLDSGTSAAGLELNGITLQATSPTITCDRGTITGNRIGDTRSGGSRTTQYAIYMSGGANFGTIEFGGNNVQNCLNAGVGGAPPITLYVHDNPGYNPVGASNQTLGASPWTYQNQTLSPLTAYVTGGTVSNVTKNTQPLAKATNCSFNLEPGESFTITYSVLPTLTLSIH